MAHGREVRAIMKIALLGTGFGQAHAAVYAQRPDIDEVIVFGRTPEMLARSAASSASPPAPIWTG
jgi:predicted dehydrogenase